MDLLADLQRWIVLALSVVALGIEAWAVLDCVRRPTDAFPAADKRTKVFWLALTAVATLLGVVSLGAIPGLLGIVGVIAAGVYLADVRPALDQVTGRGRTDGPYGPW